MSHFLTTSKDFPFIRDSVAQTSSLSDATGKIWRMVSVFLEAPQESVKDILMLLP
jgi:hypothetical protein